MDNKLLLSHYTSLLVSMDSMYDTVCFGVHTDIMKITVEETQDI